MGELDLIKNLASGGATVVVAGILIYLVVKVLPKMTSENREAITELITAFKAEQDATRQVFKEEQAAIRKERHEQVNALNAQLIDCWRQRAKGGE
jgi:hypothetical protein